MNTALALYAPPPAVSRAWAARRYPPLALAWHAEAMARRARMARVEAATLPPTRVPPRQLAAWMPAPPGVMRADLVVKREVAREWAGVTVGDIIGRGRFRTVAEARQVAMWVERETTGHSLPEIGRRCGRDHSSVFHGIQKIAGRIEADPAFAARVERVRERVEVALFVSTHATERATIR
jgi:hypothetical protein